MTAPKAPAWPNWCGSEWQINLIFAGPDSIVLNVRERALPEHCASSLSALAIHLPRQTAVGGIDLERLGRTAVGKDFQGWSPTRRRALCIAIFNMADRLDSDQPTIGSAVQTMRYRFYRFRSRRESTLFVPPATPAMPRVEIRMVAWTWFRTTCRPCLLRPGMDRFLVQRRYSSGIELSLLCSCGCGR